MKASLILCAAALLAAPASAAPVSGQPSERLALQAMQNFGRCAAKMTPAGARRLLAMDYRGEDYGEAVRRFAEGHGRCAPDSKMRFNQLLFAGALAEALLDVEVPPRERARALAFDPARPAIAARSPTEEMALCLVLQHPQQASDVLAAVPGSAEETAALKALVPSLQTCLAKGVEAQLNGPAIRSLVALAAWRVAASPAEGEAE